MNPLFSNFLNKRISKSCNITNRCMFNELFLLFTNWLSKKEDIILINDIDYVWCENYCFEKDFNLDALLLYVDNCQ